MLIKLTLDNVQKFLAKKEYQAQLQQDTGQLFLQLKYNGQDFPAFIRLYEEGDLLQLLLFIPCNIKPGTESDLARLLHLINKEIDIPGFGMDENANVIFYRLMIPAFKGQIEDELIETFIKSLDLLCKTFTPAIVAVAQGMATYDDILQRVQEQQPNQE